MLNVRQTGPFIGLHRGECILSGASESLKRRVKNHSRTITIYRVVTVEVEWRGFDAQNLNKP